MYLVQMLLPLYDNTTQAVPREVFAHVRKELIDRFGGLTAYTRAPAKGVWQEEPHAVVRDDVVVYEVMARELDRAWWADWRQSLARQFGQQELVVRAHAIELL